ncbi:hypothetical protein [Otariodibacter sp.]|uniref:hypothetical protein n=1 Tax=Otariodibacter sp. TaxID=3030919 RepID=UPI002634BD5D|nr:hypothetical protein [Otariodibacter sp.]
MFIPIVFFALGILFALITLHIYLKQQYGSIYANLYFSVGFIILGLCYRFYLSYKVKAKEKIYKNANLTDKAIRETSQLTGFDENSLKNTVNYLVNNHGRKLLLGTIVLGFLLGKGSFNSKDSKK